MSEHSEIFKIELQPLPLTVIIRSPEVGALETYYDFSSTGVKFSSNLPYVFSGAGKAVLPIPKEVIQDSIRQSSNSSVENLSLYSNQKEI